MSRPKARRYATFNIDEDDLLDVLNGNARITGWPEGAKVIRLTFTEDGRVEAEQRVVPR